MSDRDYKLYREAIHCALHTLVSYAISHNRGWYHYNDGALIINEGIAL